MQNVDGIRRMLTESIDELIPELREKMTAAGEALEFEKAAEYRDAISAVEQASHQQDVVDFDSELRDYVAVVERDPYEKVPVEDAHGLFNVPADARSPGSQQTVAPGALETSGHAQRLKIVIPGAKPVDLFLESCHACILSTEC